MNSDEKDYLWAHFVFNAEQRLKAFNFFAIFSVFANGGVFATLGDWGLFCHRAFGLGR